MGLPRFGVFLPRLRRIRDVTHHMFPPSRTSPAKTVASEVECRKTIVLNETRRFRALKATANLWPPRRGCHAQLFEELQREGAVHQHLPVKFLRPHAPGLFFGGGLSIIFWVGLGFSYTPRKGGWNPFEAPFLKCPLIVYQSPDPAFGHAKRSQPSWSLKVAEEFRNYFWGWLSIKSCRV